MSDGTRKVTSISEITGMEQDVITMQEIFAFQKTGIAPDGRVVGHVPRHRHPARSARRRWPPSGCQLPMEMFEHRQQVGGDATSGWRHA